MVVWDHFLTAGFDQRLRLGRRTPERVDLPQHTTIEHHIYYSYYSFQKVVVCGCLTRGSQVLSYHSKSNLLPGFVAPAHVTPGSGCSKNNSQLIILQ